jgi:hypothetical protein
MDIIENLMLNNFQLSIINNLLYFLENKTRAYEYLGRIFKQQ